MKIMEIIWLIMGLSALGAGIHAFVHEDMKRSTVFFVMVVISFFIFTMRIRMRKKKEGNNSSSNNEE